jgi:hypothetical protein
MCGVGIFRRLFRSLVMTRWGSGCSGPRTLRGAFKCHETLPTRQGRTQTVPKVNHARTCQRVPFSVAYYQLPVLYTFNVAPIKAEMEMCIQHTREKNINTEICLETATKRNQRQMTVYGFQYHKDTVRVL